MNKPLPLDETIARRVLETVDAGLVKGLGIAKPGSMCIEAAVCYAYGLPHSDEPPCVGTAVRAFKIRLNDARWSSNEARTAGMRAIAIAQLGSVEIDQDAFCKVVAEGTIRRVLPMALRAAASHAKDGHKLALEQAALRCEQEGTRDAALEAKTAAAAARAAARATAAARAAAAWAAWAAWAAATAADARAAADAAYAAAVATADADADADADAAAYAAAWAAAAAADVAAAATADAARAAARGADAAAADADARDEVLAISADVCLQALVACKSPGCAFLYLLDQPKE